MNITEINSAKNDKYAGIRKDGVSFRKNWLFELQSRNCIKN